jgi:sialidase-1
MTVAATRLCGVATALCLFVLLLRSSGFGLQELSATPPVVLFKPWDEGLPCWRIPSLALAGKVLVAFAEGRASSGDACYVRGAEEKRAVKYTGTLGRTAASSGDVDVCEGYFRRLFFRASTDGGKTWGPIRHLAGGPRDCMTDPSAVYHAPSGTLIVHYAGGGGRDTWQQTSSDFGATFSAPELLNEQLGPAGGSRPGPAGAVALSSGRLLVAGYSWPEGVHVWFSDDGAKTWALAGVESATKGGVDRARSAFTASAADENPNESCVVELPLSGAVLLSMRHNAPAPRRAALCPRTQCHGTDQRPVFDERKAPPGSRLPSTTFGTMGRLLALGKSVLYTNPLGPSGARSHLTLLRSDDDAASFTHGKVLFSGNATYSDLVSLPNGRIDRVGVAFEREGDGVECTGTACEVVFTTASTDLPQYRGPHTPGRKNAEYWAWLAGDVDQK